MKKQKLSAFSAFQKPFPIVGEWLYASDISRVTKELAALRFDRFREMGVTDLYLLVKGTKGMVCFQKTRVALKKDHSDGQRDILEEAIRLAHERGIRLHAWITSANDATYKAAHPEEGLWSFSEAKGNYSDIINCTGENYIHYMEELLTELAVNYDIDGLHLDYIRYNHLTNGWGKSDYAELARRGADVVALKAMMNKTFYNADKDGVTIFNAYINGDRDANILAQIRRDNINRFARRMIAAVRTVKPRIILSAALMPEGAYGSSYTVSGINALAFADLHYGQNYRDAAALYDYICPMEYSTEFTADSQWTAALAVNAANLGNRVVVGLQSFTPATSQTLLEDVEAVRGLLDNEAILGICHFRTAMFHYMKTIVDSEKRLLLLRVMHSGDSCNVETMELRLPDTVKAIEVVSGEALAGATVTVSADGTCITLSGGELRKRPLLSSWEEGTIRIRTTEPLPKCAAPVFCRLTDSCGNEIPAYQIFKAGEVPLLPDSVTF